MIKKIFCFILIVSAIFACLSPNQKNKSEENYSNEEINLYKREYRTVVRSYSIYLSKYYPPKGESTYFFSFDLCEDGYYSMELYDLWNDMILISFMSDESYEIKNDTLIFNKIKNEPKTHSNSNLIFRSNSFV